MERDTNKLPAAISIVLNIVAALCLIMVAASDYSLYGIARKVTTIVLIDLNIACVAFTSVRNFKI